MAAPKLARSWRPAVAGFWPRGFRKEGLVGMFRAKFSVEFFGEVHGTVGSSGGTCPFRLCPTTKQCKPCVDSLSDFCRALGLHKYCLGMFAALGRDSSGLVSFCSERPSDLSFPVPACSQRLHFLKSTPLR